MGLAFRICWRGANERKEERRQGVGLREKRNGRQRVRWVRVFDRFCVTEGGEVERDRERGGGRAR